MLLSDGETTVGRPTADGAQEAADAKIPVFTIAFGTDGGSITDPHTGETVPVPVQPEPLPEVGRRHRRQAYRRPPTPSSTTPTSASRGRSAPRSATGRAGERATWQWAAAALALLAAAWALAMWWLRGMV